MKIFSLGSLLPFIIPCVLLLVGCDAPSLKERPFNETLLGTWKLESIEVPRDLDEASSELIEQRIRDIVRIKIDAQDYAHFFIYTEDPTKKRSENAERRYPIVIEGSTFHFAPNYGETIEKYNYDLQGNTLKVFWSAGLVATYSNQ